MVPRRANDTRLLRGTDFLKTANGPWQSHSTLHLSRKRRTGIIVIAQSGGRVFYLRAHHLSMTPPISRININIFFSMTLKPSQVKTSASNLPHNCQHQHFQRLKNQVKKSTVPRRPIFPPACDDDQHSRRSTWRRDRWRSKGS